MSRARTAWLSCLIGTALPFCTAALAEEAQADEANPPTTVVTAAELQLETTAITGNHELPRVMVIVPWKKAAPALPAGRPLNSLVETVLGPLDRATFRRNLRYHEIQAQALADGTAGKLNAYEQTDTADANAVPEYEMTQLQSED